MNAFAIAGEDGKWYQADAALRGDRVIVSATEVAFPVAVRYAWAMNPCQRNLLSNRRGFRASPSGTDDWPFFEPNAELVEVLKPGQSDNYQTRDWRRPTLRPRLARMQE